MKISAIIPNYNHARYLPESLEALATQTSPPDEIIVIDDGSTDDSLEVLSELQKKYPQIRVEKNSANMGFFRTVEKGLNLASGDYVLVSSADDLVFRTAFEESKKILEKHPEAALCCSHPSIFLDEKPYKFLSNNNLASNQSRMFTPDEFTKLCRSKNFIIFSNTAFYRRDLLIKHFYDTSLKSLCDFYMNSKLGLSYPIAYVPKILGSFRKVSNSYGNSIRKNFRLRMKVYDRLLELITEKEPKQLRKAFFASGLISFGGYFMILYLTLNPRYWLRLPKIIYLVLRRKYCERELHEVQF